LRVARLLAVGSTFGQPVLFDSGSEADDAIMPSFCTGHDISCPYAGRTSGEMAEGLTQLEIGLGYRQPMATSAQAAQELPEKSLFRIGEVSRLTATKTFVLRYWESEFPALQPVKSPSGHRL